MNAQKGIGKHPPSLQSLVEVQELFRQVCLSHGAPITYSQLFIASIGTANCNHDQEQYKRKSCLLADEINLLKKGQSPAQVINSLLAEREEVLRSLREKLIMNKGERALELGECCEQVGHIRMYNLSIIQNVSALTRKLGISNSPYVGEVFFQLLLNMDFLRTTTLRKHMYLSNNRDPLFLIPLKRFRNQQDSFSQERALTQLFDLDEAYVKRLKKADKLFEAVTNEPNSHQSRRSAEQNGVSSPNKERDRGRQYLHSQSTKRRQTQQKQQTKPFRLPSISHKDDNELKYKRHSYSLNTLQDIIQDYENKQKMKRKYDRLISNQIKTKKRAVSQSKPHISHHSRRQKAKGRLLYVDQDNNDNLQSSAPSVNQQYHASLHQTPSNHPQAEQAQQSPQTLSNVQSKKDADDSRVSEAVIVKVKSNKLKKGRAIFSQMQSGRLKETIAHTFTAARDREDVVAERSYHSPLYGYGKDHTLQEIKLKIDAIQRMSSGNLITLPYKEDSFIEQEDSRYKIPLNIQQQQATTQSIIEIPVKKEQASSIRTKQQPQPTNQIQKQPQQTKQAQPQHDKSIITQTEFKAKQEERDRRLITQLLQAMKQTPHLKLAPNNVSEKIQVKSPIKEVIPQIKPIIQEKTKEESKESHLSYNYSIYEHRFEPRKSNLKMTPQFNINKGTQPKPTHQIESPVQKSDYRDPSANNNAIGKDRDKGSSNRDMSSSNIGVGLDNNRSSNNIAVCDVIYITPPNIIRDGDSSIKLNNQSHISENYQDRLNQRNHNTLKRFNSQNQSQPPSQIMSQGQIQSSLLEHDRTFQRASPKAEVSTYVNIFLSEQGLENQREVLRRPKVNASIRAQSEVSRPFYTKQQTSILKQCVFQSKSMEQGQLISLIGSYKSRNGHKLLEMTRNGSYFANRHIIFSTCSFQEEVICYCLTSPYMTPQSRYLFMLHLEIISQSFQGIAAQLISTFMKYIMYNDPANKLIYLPFSDIFQQSYVTYFQEIKSYAGTINTPLKSSNFEETSYLFQRKYHKCNKTEDYTTIFNTISFVVVSKAWNAPLPVPFSKQLNISTTYLRKAEAIIKSKQVRKFPSQKQLSQYLERERLPFFRQWQGSEGVGLYQMILEDCLLNSRFYVHAGYFYFTIDPPHTYFTETKDLYYLLIATSMKNKYYILADKIYEESEDIDLYKKLKEEVVNRRVSDVFVSGGEKMRGKVVGCPKFEKKVQFRLGENASGIIMFELNWKDYLKGVRYLRQEAIWVELIGPFLCGLVEIGLDNIIRHVYSTIIGREDIQK